MGGPRSPCSFPGGISLCLLLASVAGNGFFFPMCLSVIFREDCNFLKASSYHSSSRLATVGCEGSGC